MKYPDGQDIKVGDKVMLRGNGEGLVVCDIANGVFTSEYSDAVWSYLEEGVMIDFGELGLVHMKEAEPDLLLLHRRG